MFKKIAAGALLAGLIVTLVAGAIIRTNAKTGEAAGSDGRGRAVAYQGSQTLDPNPGTSASEFGQDAGARGRWAQSDAVAEAPVRQGNGNRAVPEAPVRQANGNRSVAPETEVKPEDWTDFVGTVTGATDDLVEIQTTTGETIPLEGRPLQFAIEQGLTAEVEDVVTLSGFLEDGEMKIGQVTNLSTGMSVTLRDANGRPGWAGSGWRG